MQTLPTFTYFLLQRSKLTFDLDRVHGAEYKESDERKKRRKVLRGQRKKKEDKNQQAEGLTYAAGAF